MGRGWSLQRGGPGLAPGDRAGLAAAILPSPQAVLAAWIGLFGSAGYLADIGISVARVWIAFLASAVVAIPLGVLMSSYRAVGASTSRWSTSCAICRCRPWCR